MLLDWLPISLTILFYLGISCFFLVVAFLSIMCLITIVYDKIVKVDRAIKIHNSLRITCKFDKIIGTLFYNNLSANDINEFISYRLV